MIIVYILYMCYSVSQQSGRESFSNKQMSPCIIWSFLMQILEIWSFQGTKMCFIFNDAKPFMVERVEGDDQLSFCLGAN